MALSHEGLRVSAPLPQSIAARNGSDRLLEAVLKSIDDSKAEDIVTLNIAEKTSIADFMIVASGRSHRHVGSIADRLAQDLKDQGFGTVVLEGIPACDWVLVDCGDVVVHIFRPEVRGFYNLEKMWAPEPIEPKKI